MVNIYNTAKLEAEIDQIASENDGVIPEEKMEALVLANTQAIEQVEKLVQYIRHLEMGIENVNSELERLQTIKNHASNRISSIKAYLLPFISQTHNGKLEVGTFKLSIRNSEAVITEDAIVPKQYMREKITYSPDKASIKMALQGGLEVNGAYIQKNRSLVIK